MTTLPTLAHHVIGPAGAPWLTFVPGIGNDSTFWRHQAAALADRFRVLTFDPWGHGQSPVPPSPCRFLNVVDGVVQLWDRLGVERSDVVGLGFGGSVTLSLGLSYPDRVRRLVACCCRPRQPEDRRNFWRDRQAKALAGGLPDLVKATVDRWLDDAFRARHPEVDAELRAMMQRTSVEGYVGLVEAFIEMDFDADLERLSVPTLLIAAEQDHGGGPVEDMRSMAKRIPGAHLEVISGSGHICNHERPQEVTDVLRRFLTD